MYKTIFLIALLFSNCVFAQQYAYLEQDKITETHYQLSAQKHWNNTALYFPYDGGNLGLDICKLPNEAENSYVLSTEKPFNISANTYISLPVFFSENVKNIEITVIGQEGNKHFFTKKLTVEGYQPAIFNQLTQVNNPENAPVGLARIVVKVTKNDNQRLAKLIISDLLLADYQREKVISPLPIFKKMFAYNRSNGVKELSPIFKNAKANTDWFSIEYCKSPVIIDGAGDKNINRQLFDVLRACAVDYPFYVEKQQNKMVILQQLDQIWQKDSSKSICELAEHFQQLLRKSFHDGHFKIELPCKKDKKILGALRISHIAGKYQVSAILDTLLEKEMPLGSVIISINHQPISTMTDSLKHLFYTESYAKNRQQLVLNDLARELVSFDEGSQIEYEYSIPTGEVKKSMVVYRKKYPLKPNFANIHCEYKPIDDNTVYFKLNAFDELPVLRFQSLIGSIKQKNLILDIRSNGGGDIVYLDDFLSFFTQPKNLQLITATDRTELQKDALLINNENPEKMDATSKIVVLVDGKTACSSEIFIEVLKRYNKNATIIGTDNTSGTLANAFNITLPSKDFTLTVNSPEVFKYNFGYSLEDVGITPDIKVNIESVYDLKPYNDKVLQRAIQFLNESTANNITKALKNHHK